MLQKSAVAKGAITRLPLDEFEQLAQKLLDLKGACRNATEDCLPLLRVVRSTVWPRVNLLTGLDNEPEVNAFRADVALARLRGRCQNFPHAMGFINVWKSGTDESIEKLKNISSSYHPMRNNATFCQMLDEVNPTQRSIVTFVEEPLGRFISGYAQMEVSSPYSDYWSERSERSERSSAARGFLEQFFSDGLLRNGQVRSQLEFLAPHELGCAKKFDFIGKVEEPKAFSEFLASRQCEDADHEAFQKRTTALELKASLNSSTAMTAMTSVLRANASSFLRAFCWLSLPDYVTFEYDLPSECLEDPDLREIMALTKSARAGRIDPSRVSMKPPVLLQVSAWGRKKKRKMKKTKAHLAARPRIFAGIPSAALYGERRMRWRKQWKCGDKLNAWGIPYKFIVGWPVDKSTNLTAHRQGYKATDSEVHKAELLRNESLTYKDLHFVNLPDTYLSLQSKTFALLDYGYSLGAEYVMKMDDDTCIKPHKLVEYLDAYEAKKRQGPKALYAGYYQFNGSEYKKMRGRDGAIHPYFAGPFYVLSKDLIRKIVQDDEMNSVLWARYGSTDEDAQTGRWVAFAEDQHKIHVDRIRMKHIMIWKNGKEINATNPMEF